MPLTLQARPKLRDDIRLDTREGTPVLFDPRGVARPRLPLKPVGLAVARLLDGRNSLAAIEKKLSQEYLVFDKLLFSFIETLDEGFYLESESFHAYLAGPTRRPSCIGAYPDDPAAIREQLQSLFTGPGGPGLPGEPKPDGTLRAILAPHMDYTRGGVTYGHAYKTLFEKTDANLFVIVATSHYSPARFTLTRMNFTTPLGTVETDQAYLDRIVGHYGDGLFADKLAHLPEHSIELEVVLLQYLREKRSPFRIVPLLVGSFADCVAAKTDPREMNDIKRMIAALKFAEAEAGEKVCYIISGDLAHIGPKFGDPDPVSGAQLSQSRMQDEKLLTSLAAADVRGYFDVIATEEDVRNICGLPPTVVALATTGATRGEVLHYGRSIDPEGNESVSFAAAAFYGP